MFSVEAIAKEKGIDSKLLEENTESIIKLVQKAVNSGEKFTPELVELCTKHWFEYLEKYSRDVLENKNGCFDKLTIKVLMILELKKGK